MVYAGLWHEIQGALASSTSAIEAIFALLHSLSATLSQRLASIFWSLWNHRNLKVWEDVTETCAIVVERARSLIDDWHLPMTLLLQACLLLLQVRNQQLLVLISLP